MTIHHATKTRAEKLGIILVQTDADELTEATHPKSGRMVTHENPKVALNLCALSARFANNGYLLDVSEVMEVGIDGNWAVWLPQGEHTLLPFDPEDFDEDTIFAEALEEAVERELDFEDDTPQPSGGIVDPKYKERYAALGDPDNCGDWLALFLKEQFQLKADTVGGRPVFDHDGFVALLAENGVPMENAKWANSKQVKGWQGRFRMNGRQALEKRIKTIGTFRHNGDDKSELVPELWKQIATAKLEEAERKVKAKAKKKIAA